MDDRDPHTWPPELTHLLVPALKAAQEMEATMGKVRQVMEAYDQETVKAWLEFHRRFAESLARPLDHAVFHGLHGTQEPAVGPEAHYALTGTREARQRVPSAPQPANPLRPGIAHMATTPPKAVQDCPDLTRSDDYRE